MKPPSRAAWLTRFSQALGLSLLNYLCFWDSTLWVCCRLAKGHGAARFTGNPLTWICVSGAEWTINCPTDKKWRKEEWSVNIIISKNWTGLGGSSVTGWTQKTNSFSKCANICCIRNAPIVIVRNIKLFVHVNRVFLHFTNLMTLRANTEWTI